MINAIVIKFEKGKNCHKRNSMEKDELYHKKEELSTKLNQLDESRLKLNKICDRHDEDIINDMAHYEKGLNNATGKYSVQLFEELLDKSKNRKNRNEEIRTEYLEIIEKEYGSIEEEMKTIDDEINSWEEGEKND